MFAHPLFLWTLPVLSLLLWTAFGIRSRKAQRLEEYLAGHGGPEFWPEGHRLLQFNRWRRSRGALMGIAGLLLGLALLGPQAGTRRVPVLAPEEPLVLILDVSRSMEVQDVPMGRLNAARIVARRVLGELGEVPVGLVVFAGEAHGLLPPSSNRDLLAGYLAAAHPGMLTRQGTSLVEALQEARKLVGDGMVGGGFLLLSDGEGHDDGQEALGIAQEIAEAGGRISVVSLGTEGGGVVPDDASAIAGLRITPLGAETEDGKPFSRARPTFLAELALVGQGMFAQGGDASQLSDLVGWMGGWAEEQEVGIKMMDVPREGWSWVLVLAVVGLLLELALEGASSGKREISWS